VGQFVRRHVLAGIVHMVAHVAEGLGLDQDGALAFPALLHRIAHHFIDGERIVAVNLVAFDTDGEAALVEIGLARRFLDAGGHRILVVLDHQHIGEVPDGREVEGFKEGAVVGTAIGREGDGDGVIALDLVGQRRTDAQRRAGADNAVGAEVAL
jgi:hypothetical protein